MCGCGWLGSFTLCQYSSKGTEGKVDNTSSWERALEINIKEGNVFWECGKEPTSLALLLLFLLLTSITVDIITFIIIVVMGHGIVHAF